MTFERKARGASGQIVIAMYITVSTRVMVYLEDNLTEVLPTPAIKLH
jgi:hypothetical protein